MNKLAKSQMNDELFNKAYSYFERLEAKENVKKSHPKVELDSKIAVTNYLNLVLHGPLVMGSNHQALNVIYDTAVDGLVIETDLCSSCNKASAFNTTTSSSYSKVSN
jgi:hypothetical protein